ncbi:hydrogenase-4 component G [Campylobacter sp. faydin G-24]|uniref:Hydrogenase-4 component G n=1 Tax=Campylobacter anatolicus TaxID=2829105 RepID=A0ABS5HKM3_9BACT|nr:hydrogenase-4 component G [Campylobacter anatolicus]MBR8464555.1 hydrogenase-4 component G [Campylobacter anatolicus]
MQVSINTSAYKVADIAQNCKNDTQKAQDQNTNLNALNLNDTDALKKATQMSVKEISNSYFLEFSAKALNEINAQGGLDTLFSGFKAPENLMDILSGIDYTAIGYNGKAISELSVDEANALVGEDGYFGIQNTADRLSNFVLNGAGDDLNKLKVGREGILNGFKQAQKAWGGELPEISQKTIDKALEIIDKRIAEFGDGNVLNVSA